MPKRRRKGGVPIASKRKARPSASRVAPVFSESEEFSDDHINTDDVLEGRANFLTKLNLLFNMDSEELKSDKKSKKQKDLVKKACQTDGTPGEEAGYEKTPRPSAWEGRDEKGSVHYLLPLKAERGRLIHQEPTHLDEDIGSLSDSSSKVISDEEEVGNDGIADVPKTLTAVDLFVQRQEKLMKKKESIALVASQLVENPEGNIGQLKQLRLLCIEQDPDVAVTVRKLAMMSFMAVMKDIAPSYHIRELTVTEKAVKVSKDVRRLRQFEETLLLDYQHFLSQCDETIKVGLGIQRRDQKKKRRKGRKKPLNLLSDEQELSSTSMASLAEVALKCLCELLLSLPHFNFRNNIIAILVSLMSSKTLDGKVSQMSCTTVENLFQNDFIGDVSFEAVQLISKMVKAKAYKTKPAVLQTFLHLQLHDVDNPVAAAGSEAASRHKAKTKKERRKEAKQKMTKKQKRRLHAEAKLERDLQETSAEESKEKRTKAQTEILKVVFLTYFRILKHSRHSPLLQPVLEGLAKFSHLISIDFFADLMSVLHSLAETGGLSNRECMQCVLTAFNILSGQGSALNIDLREFYIQLYGALLQLDACSTDNDVLLAVDCLDKLLGNRRKVSVQRVLGFVKRLSTVSLQLSPGPCLSVLAILKKFIRLYSQCEQLLDIDAVAGSGVYRPDVPDPEMSYSSSTSLWELADLRLHYEPAIVTYASHLLHGAPSQGKQSLHSHLAKMSPREALSLYSLQPEGKDKAASTFNPMSTTPQPPPHPALKAAQKKRGEYCYVDTGILSMDIRERAEEALELAASAINRLENTIL